MKQTRWTPTPWRAEEYSKPQWAIQTMKNFRFVAITSQANDEANAKRIISCVNGCEDVENPEAIKELVEAAEQTAEFLTNPFSTLTRTQIERKGKRLVEALANLKKEQ